jgi:hypothetical protein
MGLAHRQRQRTQVIAVEGKYVEGIERPMMWLAA